MRTEFFLVFGLMLTLSLCPWSRGSSGQERNRFFSGQGQLDSGSQSPELPALPTQLTDTQITALQDLRPAPSQVQPRVRLGRVGFYRSAWNRPITPREVAYRESIYALAARPKQFVHVRLVDGRVLTGTINYTNIEGFQLHTTLFESDQMIHYRTLAEPPRPVLGLGTKTVRGLQVTGMVGMCIVLIPLVLVVYPLIAAGVIKD